MGTIKTFQDIEAWQKARILTRKVYEASKREGFIKDFGLRDQIRAASVSIMANIAEGFEREGNKEFKQFLSLAKASTAEVKSHLVVALDQAYIDQVLFTELQELTDEIGRMVAGFMGYLSNSSIKGRKYRL